jgi:hypothetical protein
MSLLILAVLSVFRPLMALLSVAVVKVPILEHAQVQKAPCVSPVTYTHPAGS